MTNTKKSNKELARRINDEVWSKGNFELLGEYFSEDFVVHTSASPEPVRGRDGFKANVERVRTALPDVELVTRHLFSNGNMVANHWTMKGTHQGPFMGIDATGNEVEFPGMTIIKIEHDMIVEAWTIFDLLGVMKQLGVTPELEEATTE